MDNKKTEEKRGFFQGVMRGIGEESERRRTSRGALFCDIAVFITSFFFARRHFIFGAYPLASSLIAVLPSHVWIALLGAAVGSLTLGKAGIIYAINSLIIVFMRLIFSSSDKDGEPVLFREPYVMRVAAAAIGAALSGVFSVLSSGVTLSSVFSGVFGVLFSVAVAIALYGAFAYGVGFEEIVFGGGRVFSYKGGDRERWALASFCAGVLALCYLIGFSLSEYDFFGISPAYVFSSGITLFTAKRFGSVRAMAVGFVSSLGISATGAVAFALSGLGAGALFGIGFGYAVLAGGGLLLLWGAYNGGVMGVLSLFPEYSVSAMLLYPFLKNARAEHKSEESESLAKTSADMVEAMASLKLSEDKEIFDIEEALIFASVAIKEYGAEDAAGEFDEYRNILIAITSLFSPGACDENIDVLATKLYKKQRVSAEDVSRLMPDVSSADEFVEELYRLIGEYERDSNERRRMDAMAREYELISKLINDARVRKSESAVGDEELSARLSAVFASAGFPDGVIRAFGGRRKRIIGAGEDKDGSLISSPTLKAALEEEGGFKLGKFQFYRRSDVALFETTTVSKWSVEYAVASGTCTRGGVSGDTAEFFECDSVFYSLISDGMGSGRVAERTSRFVSSFLKKMLISEEALTSALSAVNHLIRHRGEECSATVDLFSFDLLTGDAYFTKCGAAPSFIKRDGSLFRIKSQTAPIGLMKEVDSEKIRVEVKQGDYIIMLSDGAYLLPDDAVWLFEYLSRPAPDSVEEFSKEILSAAKRNSGIDDDITVSVLRILA